MRLMLSIVCVCVGCGAEPTPAPGQGGDGGAPDPCARQPGQVWCGRTDNGLPVCEVLRTRTHCARCGDACPFGTQCLADVSLDTGRTTWACR